MALRSHGLRIVHQLSSAAATQSLADAIEHAEPLEVDALARALLPNPTGVGGEALVRHYHRLSAAVRGEILNLGEKMSVCLARLAMGDDFELRLRALKLIRHRADGRGVEAARASLDHEDDRLARAAGEALVAIARVAAEGDTARISDAARARLDDAITDAADRYPDHRRREALVAAVWLALDPGPRLRAWLEDAGHPSHLALRTALKSIRDDAFLRHAFEWLEVEPLAGQALTRLREFAVDPERLRPALERIHLATRPVARRRLRQAPLAKPGTVSMAPIDRLDADGRLAWLRWIDLTRNRPVERRSTLARYAADPDPVNRLAALRRLLESEAGGDGADRALAAFAFDDDPTIARLAARRLLRGGERSDPHGLLDALSRSNQSLVRDHADRARLTSDLDAFWRRWVETPVEGRSLALRRAAEFWRVEGRAALMPHLRAELTSAERDSVIAAIRFAERAELAASLELELLAAAAGSDSRIAATAIRAIAGLDTSASRQLIEAALEHGDPRARANAVEALARRGEPLAASRGSALTAKSQHHRVRANTIVALAKTDPRAAARQLAALLKDDRPMHRVAGLWAVERLGASECAAEVARIVARDFNLEVRRRAGRTARRLLARMGDRTDAKIATGGRERG
ncbi:MAG: HEAT repeat domain-containing protein [Phycisphaerales bacterium]